jgi:alkylation response protein AidB-like acyl-CoA dehydrogenase
MNFELEDEARQLAESVERFLRKDYDFAARKALLKSPTGCSPTVWQTMADLGLLSLALPEAHGGFGGGAVDLIGTMEGIGDALVLEPYLQTVTCARLIAMAGNPEQQGSVLPAVGAGAMKLSFAQLERHSGHDAGRITTRARRANSGWVISGEKRVVFGAPVADRIIVSARVSGDDADRAGLALFLLEPGAAGMTQKQYRTLDGYCASDLTLHDVVVNDSDVIGVPGEAWAVIESVNDFATALVCAEAVGAMRFANEATLEYLKTRKQFGVPIGSFQALQHRIVDMHIAAEQCRSMAGLACVNVDTATDARERSRMVSAAKIRISDACRQVSQEAIQLHGGIGMTDEMKVSHTFRRLTMIGQQSGDADHHLARYAACDR